MYDRYLTEKSKGALVELFLSLAMYRRDIVLVGGWPPYFLTLKQFNHCGSIDIDLVLRPSIIEKYESIRKIVNRLGYQQTPNIFRFERNLSPFKTKRKFIIHLDFLTEPDVAKEVVDSERLVEVQNDLKACLIEGICIVFGFNYDETIEATIPNDGKANAHVNVANIVGSLTTKGQAPRGRFKEKDYYDIYAVAGFHEGDPQKAGIAFVRSVKEKDCPIKNSIILSSLSTIKTAFSSPSKIGPSMVSRFIGSDVTTDAFERVNEFLSVVEAALSIRL